VDLSSWIPGLSLIVVPIAIHTTAVALLAFGLEARIRVKVINGAAPISDDQRHSSRERRAAVRHQHSLPFRCHAGPLEIALPPTRTIN
jgi:hypothetical protein